MCNIPISQNDKNILLLSIQACRILNQKTFQKEYTTYKVIQNKFVVCIF
jgi:hypothetical protein